MDCSSVLCNTRVNNFVIEKQTLLPHFMLVCFIIVDWGVIFFIIACACICV
jgi:hypothetical protein